MRQFTDKRLLVATHNAGKLDEMRALLAPYGVEVVGAAQMGLAEPAETEDSFVGNARISIPLRDNLQAAYVQLEVLPGKRRQGIASALLAFAEQQLTLRGRTTIMSWSDARMGVDGDADADAGVAVAKSSCPHRWCSTAFPTAALCAKSSPPSASRAAGMASRSIRVRIMP